MYVAMATVSIHIDQCKDSLSDISLQGSSRLDHQTQTTLTSTSAYMGFLTTLWHKVCDKKTKGKLNICETVSMETWLCVECMSVLFTLQSHVCMLNQSVTRIPLWCFSRSWWFEQRKREKKRS